MTLDRYGGVVLWILAFYRNFQPLGGEIEASQYIMTKLKITDPNVLNDILYTGLLNTTLAEIQNDFKAIYGCFAAPCDKRFLGEKQFFESSVTNIKNSKYPALSVLSVAHFQENDNLLLNKIPEIAGFYQYHFGYTGKIFGGKQNKLYGRGVGSILNEFQMYRLIELSKSERTSDLAHNFNIWSPGKLFTYFADHLILEFYLDGLIGKMTIRELVTSAPDRTLLMLVNLCNPSETFLHYFVGFQN